MNFSLQNLIGSLNTSWQKLTAGQKTITVVVPLLVLSLLLYGVWWSGRPSYTPLFQGPMATNEAGDVINKLKELKIPYQLSDGGSVVLVPKDKVAELRIQLASAGIPKSSKFSFDNLNSSMNFGETDADRKLRYTLGLQNELETTLKTLAPIEDARVHLALPEKSLFVEQEKESTAAVTVKLIPGGKLTVDQIRGIANLLASSIEGLKPEKVTIIDTSGQLLSQVLDQQQGGNLSGSQVLLQQSVQENLERSAQSMLDKAFGQGKSVVRVVSTLDFDQVQVRTETFGDNVLKSRQNTEESSTSTNSGSAAAPGTNTNIPNYQTPVTGSQSTSENKKTSTNETYEVSKTEETRLTNPGSIKRLSVSVLLDAQSVDEKTAETIKGIVTSAVGLSADRGDQIQVAAVAFKTETNTKFLEEEQKAMYEKSQRELYIKYAMAGGLALLFLLVVLAGLRAGKKSKQKRYLRETLVPAPVAAALEVGAGPVPVPVQSVENELFKHKINNANQAEPDEVAKVIRLWLQDDAR